MFKKEMNPTPFWQLSKGTRNSIRPRIRTINARITALRTEKKEIEGRLYTINHAIKEYEAELKHWQNQPL